MKILITAGPTREPIDAVRYLSNYSSGKMGYALAAAARRRGHRVILVSGPVNLTAPAGVIVKPVETTKEMRQAVRRYLPEVDCLIMAAAVSDYRPVQFISGKIKKGQPILQLKLVRNPDILKEIGTTNRNKILVGFALESENLLNNARRKLREKRLDYIIANAPSAFSRDRSDAVILNRLGVIKEFRNTQKSRLAGFIIRLLEKRYYGLKLCTGSPH